MKTLPMDRVQITEFYPDKATYRPGEPVEFTVTLTSTLAQPINLEMTVSIGYLAEEAAQWAQSVDIPPGGQKILGWTWTPPSDAPQGYGADLTVRSPAGPTLARAHTAFDVLVDWTQAPRYGFLANFAPDRADMDETMAWLTRYHVNGLQFYDWMYRHEDLLTAQDPYPDPLGRLLSRRTVEALIDAAHRRHIAAMPYTAIYAASAPFYRAHPGWALRQGNGEPFPFGEDFLYIMDPSPDSPWTQHLMDEFAEVLRETGFDGIHLDQYGDPKTGVDTQGKPVDLAEIIPAFIRLTQATATAVRPEATVVFNAVNNWPIESVAPVDPDFVYIEVWPPHTLYRDLWKLIVGGQELSRGKPVVLAAYIDPARARNVRLADAVILASGGYHIELGEPGGILADPYFPRYGQMSDALAEVLRRYYDFAVRYENVLALDTHDTTSAYAGRVVIEGVNTDAERVYNKVWPLVREGDGAIGLSLVNLLEIGSPEWNGLLLADPAFQENLRVRFYTDLPVTQVWWATPDGDDPAGQPLEFSPGEEKGRRYVEFRVPSLAYWDLVVLDASSCPSAVPS